MGGRGAEVGEGDWMGHPSDEVEANYLASMKYLHRRLVARLRSRIRIGLIWSRAPLLVSLLSAIPASAEAQTCGPRLTGDFRETLIVAASDGDFRRLTDRFGISLSELEGLTCPFGAIEEILSSAGFFGYRSPSDRQ